METRSYSWSLTDFLKWRSSFRYPSCLRLSRLQRLCLHVFSEPLNSLLISCLTDPVPGGLAWIRPRGTVMGSLPWHLWLLSDVDFDRHNPQGPGEVLSGFEPDLLFSSFPVLFLIVSSCLVLYCLNLFPLFFFHWFRLLHWIVDVNY